MSALNEQVGGSHYKKYKIQPWIFCEINRLTGAQTAVIDYVMRHEDKNGKQDLEKAIHHLQLMIEHYYPDYYPELSIKTSKCPQCGTGEKNTKFSGSLCGNDFHKSENRKIEHIFRCVDCKQYFTDTLKSCPVCHKEAKDAQ